MKALRTMCFAAAMGVIAGVAGVGKPTPWDVVIVALGGAVVLWWAIRVEGVTL